MYDYNKYNKVAGIIDAYLEHIHDFEGPKQQHFIARLKLCNGYHDIDGKLGMSVKDVFSYKIDDCLDVLNTMKSGDYNKVYEKILDSDSSDYFRHIRGHESSDMVMYIAFVRLSDNLSILYRNGLDELMRPYEDDIRAVYNTGFYSKVTRFVKEDTFIRKNEGTVFSNGVGYLASLNSLRPDLFMAIDPAVLNSVAEYYISELKSYDLSWSDYMKHNMIYGLTHFIINLSNFYTRPLPDTNIVKKSLNALDCILDRFIDDGYTGINFDTLCEIIVCLSLSKTLKYGNVKNIQDWLLERLDENNDRILYDKRKLFKDNVTKRFMNAEHTNILFIISFLLDI